VHGETEAGLSAVTIVELTHGIYRAKTGADRKRRQSFTDELCPTCRFIRCRSKLPNFLTGKIEGEPAAHGISIAFENLLIGSTELHLGYSVATLNSRHFRLIPSLTVLQL